MPLDEYWRRSIAPPHTGVSPVDEVLGWQVDVAVLAATAAAEATALVPGNTVEVYT